MESRMDSQDVKNAISGVLVVDKPVGMTSHDVVQVIRTGTGLTTRWTYRYIGSACFGRACDSGWACGSFIRICFGFG